MRTTSSLTLGQAAKETGQSKPTILRAIQAGRLSAAKDEQGQWAIEPAELFRVYARKPDNPLSETPVETTDNPIETVVATGEAALIAALREQLTDLKEDRARERQIADELRAELARSAEERTRLVATIEGQAKQVALLTDERTKPTPSPEPAKRGLLARLFS